MAITKGLAPVVYGPSLADRAPLSALIRNTLTVPGSPFAAYMKLPVGSGANDGLLLEASCAIRPTPVLVEECIEAGAPALLAMVANNMRKILTDLRATGYLGAIVVNNYYSLDYSNGPATALTSDLNAAICGPRASRWGSRCG
jgi:hypothetical protein